MAIQGIGGLGHLGVQFASRMGFHTVAIARGKDKENLARDLGAHRLYRQRDARRRQGAEALGGAKVILATVTSGKAMTPLIDGLGIDGTLIVVGASPEPIEVNPFHVIGARRGVRGWPSGTSVDSEDTLRFSALTGVEAMIETYPLTRAAEAYRAHAERQGTIPRGDRALTAYSAGAGRGCARGFRANRRTTT